MSTGLYKRAIVSGGSLASSFNIVSAVAGRKINVLASALTLTGGANGTLSGSFILQDGISGSALSCEFNPKYTDVLILPFNEVGWYTTSSGSALAGIAISGSALRGQVIYSEVI